MARNLTRYSGFLTDILVTALSYSGPSVSKSEWLASQPAHVYFFFLTFKIDLLKLNLKLVFH